MSYSPLRFLRSMCIILKTWEKNRWAGLDRTIAKQPALLNFSVYVFLRKKHGKRNRWEMTRLWDLKYKVGRNVEWETAIRLILFQSFKFQKWMPKNICKDNMENVIILKLVYKCVEWEWPSVFIVYATFITWPLPVTELGCPKASLLD